VTSTALATDPAARYPTVDALGRDVGRVLRGEPIEVGPPGAVHQLGRLVRRHRPLVAAAAVVILTLAGGLVATSLEARRAEQEAVRADAAAGFLEELFRASDPRQARGETPDARELLRRGAVRLRSQLRGQVARVLLNLDLARADLGEDDDARRLMERALAMAERTLKPGQPVLARALGSLADHHFKHGRFAAAEPLYRWFMAQPAGGAADPERQAVLGNWARLLRATGRDAEAVRVEAAGGARGARRGPLDPFQK